jgi:uncharacterized protein YbjT (DUF2867 family)
MLATKFESNHASGLSLRAETEPSNARWRCCMPTTSTVLAVGTTGNVGSMLIPMLCAAGVQVRALVRDETKAQPLRDQGVEMVFGDLDRPETLDAAVDGAAKIYLTTWNGPNGVTHGHNLITAAQRAGRPQIVKQGGYGSPRSRIIQHHWHMGYELRTSGLPYTLLVPTFFIQKRDDGRADRGRVAPRRGARSDQSAGGRSRRSAQLPKFARLFCRRPDRGSTDWCHLAE